MANNADSVGMNISLSVDTGEAIAGLKNIVTIVDQLPTAFNKMATDIDNALKGTLGNSIKTLKTTTSTESAAIAATLENMMKSFEVVSGKKLNVTFDTMATDIGEQVEKVSKQIQTKLTNASADIRKHFENYFGAISDFSPENQRRMLETLETIQSKSLIIGPPGFSTFLGRDPDGLTIANQLESQKTELEVAKSYVDDIVRLHEAIKAKLVNVQTVGPDIMGSVNVNRLSFEADILQAKYNPYSMKVLNPQLDFLKTHSSGPLADSSLHNDIQTIINSKTYQQNEGDTLAKLISIRDQLEETARISEGKMRPNDVTQIRSAESHQQRYRDANERIALIDPLIEELTRRAEVQANKLAEAEKAEQKRQQAENKFFTAMNKQLAPSMETFRGQEQLDYFRGSVSTARENVTRLLSTENTVDKQAYLAQHNMERDLPSMIAKLESLRKTWSDLGNEMGSGMRQAHAEVGKEISGMISEIERYKAVLKSLSKNPDKSYVSIGDSRDPLNPDNPLLFDSKRFIQNQIESIASRGAAVTELDATKEAMHQLNRAAKILRNSLSDLPKEMQDNVYKSINILNRGMIDLDDRVRSLPDNPKHTNEKDRRRAMMAQIYQQGAYAVEDFAQQVPYMGVTGGLRAAGNNLSQIGYAFGPTTGVITGLAVAVTTVLIPSLENLWSVIKNIGSEQTKVSDTLSRLYNTPSGLAKSLPEGMSVQFGLQSFGEGVPSNIRDMQFQQALQKRNINQSMGLGLDAVKSQSFWNSAWNQSWASLATMGAVINPLSYSDPSGTNTTGWLKDLQNQEGFARGTSSNQFEKRFKELALEGNVEELKQLFQGFNEYIDALDKTKFLDKIKAMQKINMELEVATEILKAENSRALEKGQFTHSLNMERLALGSENNKYVQKYRSIDLDYDQGIRQLEEELKEKKRSGRLNPGDEEIYRKNRMSELEAAKKNALTLGVKDLDNQTESNNLRGIGTGLSTRFENQMKEVYLLDALSNEAADPKVREAAKRAASSLTEAISREFEEAMSDLESNSRKRYFGKDIALRMNETIDDRYRRFDKLDKKLAEEERISGDPRFRDIRRNNRLNFENETRESLIDYQLSRYQGFNPNVSGSGADARSAAGVQSVLQAEISKVQNATLDQRRLDTAVEANRILERILKQLENNVPPDVR